jgi:hypothetical protein
MDNGHIDEQNRSARNGLIRDLEWLASVAWRRAPTKGTTKFLFAPQIAATANGEPLNAALLSLYHHAQQWAPGLQIPHHVPRLCVSPHIRRLSRLEVDATGRLILYVAPQCFDSVQAIWPILAFEVCHHVLAQSVRGEQYDRSQNLRMTDTAMFICGPGNHRVRNDRLAETLMFVCGFGDLVNAAPSFAGLIGSENAGSWEHLSPEERTSAYNWTIAARRARNMPGMDDLARPSENPTAISVGASRSGISK